MKESKAFSPCHITGFFQIFDQVANSLYVGSRGAGVSLSRGVETLVKVKKSFENFLQVRINGNISNSAEVSEHIVGVFLSRFEEVKNFEIIVEHDIKVPVGVGFGTSGAATLSLGLALNEVFDLGMSRIEAAQLAHIAEVECKTGLGTVIAEAFGGVEIRIKPGAPGIGEIIHVPISKDYIVACLTLESLPTKKCLTNEKIRRRISEIDGNLVDKLIEEPNITNFLKFSRQFAEHVGLITERIRRVLNETDAANFVCSMPMFGEAVFTLIEQESLEKLLKIFRNYGSNEKIIISEIDHKGARLL
jgi:pantoate kinase